MSQEFSKWLGSMGSYTLLIHGIYYIYINMGSVRFPGPPDLGSLLKCY